MHCGSWIDAAPFRRALVAIGLGVVTIVLATPVLAAPSAEAVIPRLQAVDYVSKLPPGIAQSDSERVYMASMQQPRTSTGAIHLHGGVYSPIDATNTNALLGMRLGINMGAPVLFGVQTGWTYHTKTLDSLASGPPGLNPKTVLARGTANLIPAMLFLQATLTQKFFLAPYVGIAAGYEWLYLTAEDYRTGATASLTYSNPAWEWYAGMGIRISRGVRLDGEAFYHGATMGRDVLDANGNSLRETVDLDGVGARVGLNIIY